MVTFRNRNTMKLAAEAVEPWSGRLDSEVYGDVRNVAPGWDPYHIEQEWRVWLGENEILPKNAERHLLKFAQSWFEKRGRP